MMRKACVTTKTRKMGMSVVTDSLTPRMFMTSRMPMTTASTVSFQCAQPGGSTLKIWSPPLAMETEMVST